MSAARFDRRCYFVLVAVLSCWAAGCGGSGSGLETAPVSGQVTYRGQPLSCGEIKFIPIDASGQVVRVAYGTLDEDGRYRLSTYEDRDGALLGTHRVTVVSREDVSETGKRLTPKGPVPARLPKSFIPEKYANPTTSGLTAEVTRRSNRIDFDLNE